MSAFVRLLLQNTGSWDTLQAFGYNYITPNMLDTKVPNLLHIVTSLNVMSVLVSLRMCDY